MDLKIKDVAELLSVSETTIRRWLTEGKIPAYKLNHQYRFSRMEIENWMMSLKVKGSKESFTSFIGDKTPEQEVSEDHVQRSGRQQFSLYRSIHKGKVLADVEGTTKEEIIRNVVKSVEAELEFDADVVAELLLDRENLMPTALNNAVAVPHTREFISKRHYDAVIVVFPKQPVEWGALDGKPVSVLFFLFAGDDKSHLHLLSKLAHFSNQDSALAFLKEKPSKEKVLEFVKNWESQLSI